MFVQTTVFEEVLELRPVDALRRFSGVREYDGDLVAFAFAIVLARTQSGQQAEILRLLFRADSAVDYGTQGRLVRVSRT